MPARLFVLTLVNIGLTLYFILGQTYVPADYVTYVNIAVYLILLISVTYATEVNVALSGVREFWNVMIVSAIFTIPQTLYAIQLAVHGKPIAAWVDTIASTIVDAMLVTAAVRRKIVGSPIVWAALLPMVGWSMAALSINFFVYRIAEDRVLNFIYLLLGYIVLPGVTVNWRNVELPSKWQLITLINNSVAMGVASWFMSEEILKLHMAEVQLGVLSTILGTLPDFFVAMVMRASFALMLSEEASDVEMLKTMIAGAIHDQISVPALILLFEPAAAAYYPHMLNIIAVALKFTLLSKKAYWLIGFPTALLVLLMPPV